MRVDPSAALVLLLLASAAAPALGSGELIFGNTFEEGSLCLWSSVLTSCVSEDDVDVELTGVSVPFCVAATESLCTDSTCDGAPGCPATATLGGVTSIFSVTYPDVSATATIDDLDLPVDISGVACTEHLSSASAAVDLSLPEPNECFQFYRYVTLDGSPSAPVSATVAMSGENILCTIASPPNVLGNVEAGLEQALSPEFDSLLLGQLLCRTP